MRFSVIGNMNAITYNDVFPHIKANRLWYGPASISSGDREFGVPSHYPLDAAGTRIDRERAEVHPGQRGSVVHEHRPRSSPRATPVDDNG